ncbi:MAG: hypothetical protein K2W82_07790 [Candidatus Obscuribacterales bacterium]|nr:hypothetical protein [Candidatus Obscuribacterales bacterium]
MPESTDVMALITRIEGSVSVERSQASTFLVRLLLAGAEFPGFWSGEIIPPLRLELAEWTLIQRFANVEAIEVWRQSEERKKILGELSSDLRIWDDLTSTPSPGTVATSIVTDVKAGMHDEYWSWLLKIQKAQAQFPGYAGIYLQPPAPGTAGCKWTSVLRFDTAEDLERWFSSPVRQELLAEANQFVNATYFQRLTSSFPGWFPIDNNTGARPAKWKTAVLVFIGLFPLLMLLKRFFYPQLAGINPAVATAVGTAVSVSIMTWFTMPILIYGFNWWLLPNQNTRLKNNIAGSLLAILIVALEIFFLHDLLPY